jgi:GNAT superfamily N-acetyltransferase
MLIQALTGSHKRQNFDCKRPELNDWFAKIAQQHQDKGLSKTFVAVPDDAPTHVWAYYALTLTEVQTVALPDALRKRLPQVVPGVRLGRLAVDQSVQGHRLGELLLMDAMQRVRVIREHAGVFGLFIDALDDAAKGFYLHYGAVPFAHAPLKLYLPVS